MGEGASSASSLAAVAVAAGGSAGAMTAAGAAAAEPTHASRGGRASGLAGVAGESERSDTGAVVDDAETLALADAQCTFFPSSNIFCASIESSAVTSALDSRNGSGCADEDVATPTDEASDEVQSIDADERELLSDEESRVPDDTKGVKGGADDAEEDADDDGDVIAASDVADGDDPDEDDEDTHGADVVAISDAPDAEGFGAETDSERACADVDAEGSFVKKDAMLAFGFTTEPPLDFDASVPRAPADLSPVAPLDPPHSALCA